jgi:crooked neck
MVFADDERESNPTSFKFLQMAHAWKSGQAKKGGAGSGSGLLSGFVASTKSSADKPDDASDVASFDGGD